MYKKRAVLAGEVTLFVVRDWDGLDAGGSIA